MILSLPLHFFLTWQMQELTELFASPPRPEKCPSLSSSLSSSRTAATPPCLLVCGLFSAQSYQPFGAHWSTSFTFLLDRHILFLWIPLTLIFASWTFFILLLLYFSQSEWRSFCIQTDFFSSFFVFYCFTFAFLCCHLYLFQFCFFSSLTADPLRIQSTKGPAPKFPFFKKCSLYF